MLQPAKGWESKVVFDCGLIEFDHVCMLSGVIARSIARYLLLSKQ